MKRADSDGGIGPFRVQVRVQANRVGWAGGRAEPAAACCYTSMPMRDERGLLEVLLGDGRFLIALTGISLALSGGFAVLQSVSGQLLPQDSHAIGMDSLELTHAGNRHLLGFMFHDRVAYGGCLVAIGAGYLWLSAFPMQVRAAWAWWALCFSGVIGFLAFLTYLGQGYLDTWHGVATLFLLPVFAAGLWRGRGVFRCAPLGCNVTKIAAHSPDGEEFFWGHARWA